MQLGDFATVLVLVYLPCTSSYQQQGGSRARDQVHVSQLRFVRVTNERLLIVPTGQEMLRRHRKASPLLTTTICYRGGGLVLIHSLLPIHTVGFWHGGVAYFFTERMVKHWNSPSREGVMLVSV